MTTEQKILFRQIVAELLGLDVSKVSLAQTNMPKQTKNFAKLRYYGHNQEVPSEGVGTDIAGEEMVISRNQLTCEVQFYATSGYDACQALQQLVDGFDRRLIIDRMDAGGLVMIEANPVQDISELLDDTTWETRASVDIMIRYTSTVTDDIGYIDTVEITGNTKDSLSELPDINIREGN